MDRDRPQKTIPIKHLLSFCPNCGEKGPHYVPPSMGDRGFFMCESNPELVKQKRAEVEERHGIPKTEGN